MTQAKKGAHGKAHGGRGNSDFKATPSETQSCEEQMKAQFHELDSDGNGLLSFDEICALLTALNSGLTPDELRLVYDAIDTDGSGEITIDEFIEFIDPDCKRRGSREQKPGKVAKKKRKGNEPAVVKQSEPPRTKPPAHILQQWAIRAHNAKRAKHGAPPLMWSTECHAPAVKQAILCQSKGFLHRGNQWGKSGPHGQSLYYSAVPLDTEALVQECIEHWYSEIDNYDFETHTAADNNAQFTQLVWASTTKFGFGLSDDGRYVVCNYVAAGNTKETKGAYEKNVFKLISQ